MLSVLYTTILNVLITIMFLILIYFYFMHVHVFSYINPYVPHVYLVPMEERIWNEIF